MKSNSRMEFAQSRVWSAVLKQGVIACAVAMMSLAFISQAEAETRTWTDRSGKFSRSAEMVFCTETNVVLRDSHGKLITVNIDKLADEDQAFVRSQGTSFSTDASPRVWHEANSKRTIKATLVGVDADIAILEDAKGNIKFVDLPTLASEDADFARQTLHGTIEGDVMVATNDEVQLIAPILDSTIVHVEKSLDVNPVSFAIVREPVQQDDGVVIDLSASPDSDVEHGEAAAHNDTEHDSEGEMPVPSQHVKVDDAKPESGNVCYGHNCYGHNCYTSNWGSPCTPCFAPQLHCNRYHYTPCCTQYYPTCPCACYSSSISHSYGYSDTIAQNQDNVPPDPSTEGNSTTAEQNAGYDCCYTDVAPCRSGYDDCCDVRHCGISMRTPHTCGPQLFQPFTPCGGRQWGRGQVFRGGLFR